MGYFFFYFINIDYELFQLTIMKKDKNQLKGLKVTYIEGHPLPNKHGEFRRRQYEDLINNKDIIKRGTQHISDAEEQIAHDWWRNHECFRSKKFWDHTAEIWSPYPHVHFYRTSIGTSTRVVCPECNEEKDVTDYERW